jgi:hypothetical protein
MTIEMGSEIVTGIVGAVIGIPVTLAFSDPIAEGLAKVTFGLITTNDGQSFGGSWEAKYWRCDDLDENTRERHSETLQLRQIGRIVVGRRLNEKNIRLSGRIRNSRYLTGVWYDTRPNRQRFGSFQFTMQADGERMVGRWVGFSAVRNDHMRHGEWDLRRHVPDNA